MNTFKESEQYQLIWKIRRLFRAMGSYANQYLEELSITAPERAVMEFLLEEKLTVPEIAAKFDVSRQHIQTNVNSLIEKDLVKTEINPRHRRSNLIVLTEQGGQLFKEITQKDRFAVQILFENVSQADCKQSLDTINKMLNNLKEGSLK